MSSQKENNPETLQPNLSPAETCLVALLDLRDVQPEGGPGQQTDEFWKEFHRQYRWVPDDLETNFIISTESKAEEQTRKQDPSLHVKIGEQLLDLIGVPATSHVEGADRVATVTVDFVAKRIRNGRSRAHFDFINTPDGLQVMHKIRRQQLNGKYAWEHIKQLSEAELAAMTQDAVNVKNLLIEKNERTNLSQPTKPVSKPGYPS